MTEQDLFHAIGEVSQDLIAESADDTAFRAACRMRMFRHVGRLLAACMALMLVATPLLCVWLASFLRGGNDFAMPPMQEDNDAASVSSGDKVEDPSSYPYQKMELLVTSLPQNGNTMEGVALYFSVPTALFSQKECFFCIDSDGLTVSKSRIDLHDASVDEKGNCIFFVRLLGEPEPAQGTVTFSLVCPLSSDKEEKQILWQRIYTYRLEGNMLVIDR